MGEMRVRISTDSSEVRQNLGNFRKIAERAIEIGIEKSAKQLLIDCRPYVPMLTGALRDSGRVQSLQNYAYELVWDAANPRNDYVYARRQYEEVFQHVDGRYAAEWVKKTLEANPGRYTFLAVFYTKIELKRMFGGGENVR